MPLLKDKFSQFEACFVIADVIDYLRHVHETILFPRS
jgi:hypothetical protein